LAKRPPGPVYDKVEDGVIKVGGHRLGETVFLVPLLLGKSSELCGAKFWNALQGATAGHLYEGDSFYVHYAPDTKNMIGGIAQVVPANSHALARVIEPEA